MLSSDYNRRPLRIAIVCPSPIPFVLGGAERLWHGLFHYINSSTTHIADLIKVPTHEHGLLDLVKSYLRFAELDLSGFDVVICGKYPAWMIRHPRIVVFMQHKLRGLYDCYPAGWPLTYTGNCQSAVQLASFMRASAGDWSSLERFKVLLRDLVNDPATPADAIAFPSPMAREVLQYLDGLALASHRIGRFATQSHIVAQRAEHFPNPDSVEVIYPPTGLAGLQHESFGHFFTSSRLDHAKRIDLIIKAFRASKTQRQLKIAGTGPAEAALRELAAGDARIEFLGYLRDPDLVHAYNNAVAVLFTPFDEDFGLVALEAMMAGKPVLTVKDSGGPAEIVGADLRGIVTECKPLALAKAIDQVDQDPALVQRLGAAGSAFASGITWQNFLGRLVPDSQPVRLVSTRKRKRIAVICTYPIYPPQGGGQVRVSALYKALSVYADIEILTFCSGHPETMVIKISDALHERRITMGQPHLVADDQVRQESGFREITDAAFPLVYEANPEFVSAVTAACCAADIVIACQPYVMPLIRSVTRAPVILEAQNVEYLLKKAMYPAAPSAQKLLQTVFDVEQLAVNQSVLITTCSEQDELGLTEVYGVSKAKMVRVPNGSDCRATPFTDFKARQLNRKRMGIEAGQLMHFFMGSSHKPNADAVEKIFECAVLRPTDVFLIAGSVLNYSFSRPVPANVRLLGFVDAATKLSILASAHFALNPMLSGSGTNLKMVDYLAAGVPVISTEVGARGLGLTAKQHYLEAPADDFAAAIALAATADHSPMTESARAHVVAQFDWSVIGEGFAQALRKRGLI